MENDEVSGYRWDDAELTCAHGYLLPTVIRELAHLRRALAGPTGDQNQVFDLGCGNGSVANELTKRGWLVTGVDPSIEGIAQARARYPDIVLCGGSAYENLSHRFGQYPAVVSLEVVEHVYDPRRYAATLFSLVKPGGVAIVSTPYHGYWKNCAMAVSGRMDAHFTALWDHGHIKFWSIRTLSILLAEAGFAPIRFERVGRVPALAKSMIAIAGRQ